MKLFDIKSENVWKIDRKGSQRKYFYFLLYNSDVQGSLFA